jgi:predicted Co/Zn/Cd cation transporter (cation efflux family)
MEEAMVVSMVIAKILRHTEVHWIYCYINPEIISSGQ